MKQYLRTIQQAGLRPYFTRSDRGKETPLWVSAQASLAEVAQTEVSFEDEAGQIQTHRQGNLIESCHMYGPSTRNIKIECWWRLLRQGASDRWIVSYSRTKIESLLIFSETFSHELIDNGLFSPDNLADQIAVYAIYGPMIRNEFADFVQLWNGHKIRTQKNRPHVISGIPMDLYRTDKVTNWGVPIEDDSDCGQLLRTMLQPLEQVDIDEFMTPITMQWCEQQLAALAFTPDLRTEEDLKRPHLQIYIHLRDLVKAHIESQQEPHLELMPIPTGGTETYVSEILLLSYELTSM